MAPEPVSQRRKPSFRQAFTPFWISLVLGALLLARDYHLRHAPLTRILLKVTVQGNRPDDNIFVDVNGRTQDLDAPVPMGFAKINIHGSDTEVVSLDRFIWYGTTDLGSVDLVRSRGSLTARVSPTPDTYELTGRLGNWTNATGSFTDVPVGRYELTCRFGALVERQEVGVIRNQNNLITLIAKIGSLELSSEPSDGEFEVRSGALTRSLIGRFPAEYHRLPEGDYRLIAMRSDYRREQEFKITRNETNRIKVKFVFGTAEITTTPPGATVFWGGKERGRTPLTLSQIVPGSYPMEVKLEGYDSQSMEVKVGEDSPARMALTLINTRYREAMASARQSLELKRYALAARHLQAALLAQPGDSIATKLLPGTRALGLRDRAIELAQQEQFDDALIELNSALRDAPDDAEIAKLQENLRNAKAQLSSQRTEAKFRQLLSQASAASAGKEYQKALALFEDAQRIYPERELLRLQPSFLNEKARLVQSLKDQKLIDAITQRQNDFKAALDQVLSNERDAGSFQTQNWKTAKSATDVRVALERLGSQNGLYKMHAFNQFSAPVWTAKLGEIPPGFVGGHYIQIVVGAFEDGTAQIALKLFEYSGGAPETNSPTLQRRLDRFRKDFAVQLGADLR